MFANRRASLEKYIYFTLKKTNTFVQSEKQKDKYDIMATAVINAAGMWLSPVTIHFVS